MKFWIYILLIMAIVSCTRPVQVFEIVSEQLSVSLELYGDSTFIEKVSDETEKYIYSGSWSGNYEDGAEFKTKVSYINGKSMFLSPERTYEVENGQVTVVSLYIERITELLDTEKSKELKRILKEEKVDRMIKDLDAKKGIDSEKFKI